MTIRRWIQTRLAGGRTSFTQKNFIDRYGRNGDQSFKGEEISSLVSNDPSFELQANWFAAARYGLLQTIPESARSTIANIPSADDRAAIRAVYDPMTMSPLTLFSPDVSLKIGSIELAKSFVTFEAFDAADGITCPEPKPNECTWWRLWRRRLNAYNWGQEVPRNGDVSYANTVFGKSDDYLPR